MAAGATRVDRGALAAWLGDLFGAALDPAHLCIAEPAGGGWSNDTLFVDTSGTVGRRVVVRLAPTGPAMFPLYDLSRQTAVMRELDASGRVPVPEILGTDLEGSWLGRPAFVMSFVDGRVPVDDRPSFAEHGFLFEASAAEQHAFHVGLLGAMAAVHACLTPSLAKKLAPVGPAAAAALADLRRIWEFDRGDRWSPVVDDALARLSLDVPTAGNDVLLWGDARPANVIVPADVAV